MSRLPIRWRVTGSFALCLVIVLAALGSFIYLRFDDELGASLDRGLIARSGEVGPLVARSGQAPGGSVTAELGADEHLVQVLRLDGSVVATTAAPGVPSLLTKAQLARVATGPVFFDRSGDAAFDEALRLLASPVRRQGELIVVVVASPLDDKTEALASLMALELLGFGAALALASAAGYVVAGVALRPVEAMRRRAAEITGQPDVRLPVPLVNDELGRLGVTLNAMLDRLDRAQESERAMIAKDRRFVEDASHELRTPLTVLKSELEVALIGDREAAALRTALTSALEETDRLCSLSEDLLLLAQSDSDMSLALHREPLAVSELLERVAARCRRHPSAVGRTIHVDASTGPLLSGDRARLEQALSNLVDNALRHGSGDVAMTAVYVGRDIRMAVRDYGAGFPVGFTDYAFDRFSRADASRGGGGSGLGLSIVQAVAAAHDGVASVLDVTPGAYVEMRLPID